MNDYGDELKDLNISDSKKRSLAMLKVLGEQKGAKGVDQMAMSLLQSILAPDTDEEDQFKQIFIERELQNESPDYQTIYDLMSGKTSATDVLNKTGTSAVEKALKASQESALNEMLEYGNLEEADAYSQLDPRTAKEYEENKPTLDIFQKAGIRNQKVLEKLSQGDIGYLFSNMFSEPGAEVEKNLQKEYLTSLLNK